MANETPLMQQLPALLWSQAQAIGPTRSAELLGEISSIVAVARSLAVDNRFNDEPAGFAASLERLAVPSGGRDE